MSKLAFLTAAIADGAPMDKEWVIRCSAVVKNKDTDIKPFYPYVKDSVWVYYDKDYNTHEIYPYRDNTPLFTRDEYIAIDKEVIPNVEDKEIITTWGVLVLNLLIWWYPFKGLVKYWNVPFLPKLVDKEWKRLIDEKSITIDQLLLSSAGASQITGFNTLFTPSYTERTTRACPAAQKLLKKLLAEHKTQLSDPTVVADILEQVYQVDKAWIEADTAGGKGFLIADKSYRVVRMHLLYTQILHSIDGDITTAPLTAGLDVKKLPAANNESMKGSLDRGFNTALGGVAVKEILRLLANVTITTDDCNSQIGVRFVITKDDLEDYTGRYLIGKQGKITKLTSKNIGEYLGKEVIMRDPNTCKAKGFCGICCGDNIASNPEGIKGQGIEWGSVMVALFMAAMHGTSLVTEDYDLMSSLS